jgi:hypothetical protein
MPSVHRGPSEMRNRNAKALVRAAIFHYSYTSGQARTRPPASSLSGLFTIHIHTVAIPSALRDGKKIVVRLQCAQSCKD